MENTPQEFAHIKGWGIDADPKNDPTYPMRKRSQDNHEGYSWNRPTLQPKDIEVLHSIERPNVTAVFGTAAPPARLSGMIRRMAFKASENSYLHWLPLLVADRVDMVEGLIDDLAHGHIPNIYAEKGYPAEWKHSKSTLLTKAAIGLVLVSAVVALATINSKNSDKD